MLLILLVHGFLVLIHKWSFCLLTFYLITWILNVNAGIFFRLEQIDLALSSSKLSWKFDKSLKFTVSNANAKYFASVGFSGFSFYLCPVSYSAKDNYAMTFI